MKLNCVLALAIVASISGGSFAAEPDFSSPKATMKTLLGLVRQGELDRVTQCFVEPQTEDERIMLMYGVSDDIYLPVVHKALVEKFGEEASPLGKVLAGFDQQLQVADALQETIDGTTGRLAIKGREQFGVEFLKVKNQWRFALKPSYLLRAVPADRIAPARALRAAYLDTVQEIGKGKFATADAAMQTLEARRIAARKR